MTQQGEGSERTFVPQRPKRPLVSQIRLSLGEDVLCGGRVAGWVGPVGGECLEALGSHGWWCDVGSKVRRRRRRTRSGRVDMGVFAGDSG